MKTKDTQNRIVTIPNLLSTFRLLLIPVMIWLYCVKENYEWTMYILMLSWITDIADGFIARQFHMVSNVGKVLDPIADKLTQAAMLFCLITRFRLMLVLLILFVLKEAFMGITGLLVIKKTGKVTGAKWHGKIVTGLLYVTMITHVIWYDISVQTSNILIIGCIFIMMVSLVLYGMDNIRILKAEYQK